MDFFLNNGAALVNADCKPDKPGCINDQDGEKATALRSYARAAFYAPFASLKIKQMLQTTAIYEARKCKGEGASLICGEVLRKEGEKFVEVSVAKGGFEGPLSALSAVQALLYESSLGKIAVENPANGNGNKNQGKTEKSGAHTLGAGWAGIIIGTSVAVLGMFVQ